MSSAPVCCITCTAGCIKGRDPSEGSGLAGEIGLPSEDEVLVSDGLVPRLVVSVTSALSDSM